MSNIAKPATLEDLLNLFADVVSPEDVMCAKIMAQISSAIVKERIIRGMTLKEFAKYIHISHRTLSRIESGNYDISIQIPVDKEYYDSIKVGDTIADDFRMGSLVTKGSFGSWDITVEDKEIQ